MMSYVRLLWAYHRPVQCRQQPLGCRITQMQKSDVANYYRLNVSVLGYYHIAYAQKHIQDYRMNKTGRK